MSKKPTKEALTDQRWKYFSISKNVTCSFETYQICLSEWIHDNTKKKNSHWSPLRDIKEPPHYFEN